MNLNLGKENFMADLKFMPELKKVREDICGQSACVDLNKESEMENVNKVESEMENRIEIEKKALREILIEGYMQDNDYNEYDAELCADNDIEHDYDYWAREYADDILLYAKA